jgi:hypothetical protein
LESAIQDTTFFLYKCDIVPFLLVDSIFQFFWLVATVDKLKFPVWGKVLMDHEVLVPMEDILAVYQQAVKAKDDATMPTIEKAPTVYVPAKTIVWIEPKPTKACCCLVTIGMREEHEVTFCDPQKVIKMGLFVTPGGIADHITGRYEYALEYAEL